MNIAVQIFLGFFAGLLLSQVLIHTARQEHEVSSIHVLIQALSGVKRGFLFLYFLVGVITALLFFLNASLLGEPIAGIIFYQILTMLLLTAALFDLAFRLIPVLLLSGLILLIAAASGVYGLPLAIQASFIGGIVVGVMVLLLYAITRGRGIGEADILMGVVIGGLFGWQKGLLVFSAANILGLFLLLPMIAVFGKKRMKQIPLVFFLVIAIFLEWYIGYTGPILKLLLIS